MISEVIQQNFASPLGLTALLSLIPLIIFYLVKPKPERELMPSMLFFAEEKQEGKIRNALNKLKANRMLFLHFLLLAGAATAIANPLIPGLNEEGKTVLLLDSSASMNGDEEAVREFAFNHLSQSNTVVIVGSEVEVLGNDLSRSEAKNALSDYEASMSSTNLISGLKTASDFEGKIVIASDMGAGSGEADLQDFLDSVSSQRDIELMDLSHRNSHGFTNIEKREEKIYATIRNFRGVNKSLQVEKPEDTENVDIEPYSSVEVTLNLPPGTHEIILPSDEFNPDNTLYVSVPQNEKITVKQVGKTSKYFKKALELIEKTEITQGKDLAGADVYYLSQSFEISNERLNKLSELNENGTPLIFEERSQLPGFVPVENRTGTVETKVTLDGKPVTEFRTNVTRYDIKGESMADPEEALVLSNDEDILIKNVESDDFGRQITYPVFWKDTIQKMVGKATFAELNLKTNQENMPGKKNKPSKEGESGFYGDEKIYAYNLIDSKESKPFTQDFNLQENTSSTEEKGESRNYILSLLVLFSMFEVVYLSRRGALE